MKGVSPRNISFCMKVIENRVSELLQLKGEYEVRELVELDGMPLPKKPPPAVQHGPKVKHCGGPFLPKIQVTGHMDGLVFLYNSTSS